MTPQSTVPGFAPTQFREFISSVERKVGARTLDAMDAEMLERLERARHPRSA